MDSRFYDKQGNFVPINIISDNTLVSCVPIDGLGRPQSNVNVLVGDNGCFLTVVENLDTCKASKEFPLFWNNNTCERFLELYGPMGSTSYRFNRWLDSKICQGEN
jgi:hypothetical protein